MRSHFRVFWILAVVAVLLLLSTHRVRACSCISQPTVDIVADGTPNIATFRVERVEESPKAGGLLTNGATLVVEKVFKGNLTPGDKFVFLNEGICVISFDASSAGKRYLLYLGERPALREAWAAGLCTRSGRLEALGGDVLYLEKRAQVRGKTRLSGTVSQQVEIDGKPRNWYFKNLAGIPLRIRGEGKNINLKTDKNGAYELYDLPPGKYDIILPEVKGFTPGLFDEPGKPVAARIVRKKHTEQNFFYNIDNSIAGTLIDDQGLPVRDTCLELVPTSHILPSYLKETACTDTKGKFEFFEILSGTYVLAGNRENKISPRDPFPTFYYPDRANADEAFGFTVAPGVHFTGLVVRSPRFSGVVNLSGVMRFSDGRPVSNADVKFFAGVSNRSEVDDPVLSYASRTETDENGNFRIRVMAGQNGILIGSFTAHREEYRHCRQIKKLIEAGGFVREYIETPAVRVDASEEIGGIELKYPFPACSKRTNTRVL
jgi:hypothetical protein